MLKRTLQKNITSDLFRYAGDTTFKSLVKNIAGNSGFRYMYILRKSQFYNKNNKYLIQRIIFRALRRRYTYKYGYQILEKTQIGEGLYINHIGSIVVNPKAVIGKNVNLTTGVVIGKANRGEKKGYPTIGDMVWIGANATIVGAVNVGNNVLIAPNSYVNFDVPDDSIVIGNPGKIIPKEKATVGYINNFVQ